MVKRCLNHLFGRKEKLTNNPQRNAGTLYMYNTLLLCLTQYTVCVFFCMKNSGTSAEVTCRLNPIVCSVQKMQHRCFNNDCVCSFCVSNDREYILILITQKLLIKEHRLHIFLWMEHFGSSILFW